MSFQPGQSEAPTGDEDDISPLTCSLRFNAVVTVTAVVLAVITTRVMFPSIYPLFFHGD